LLRKERIYISAFDFLLCLPFTLRLLGTAAGAFAIPTDLLWKVYGRGIVGVVCCLGTRLRFGSSCL